ncbi:hypothetical protein [Polymorphospora rubra]|uniref:Aminoacyl-transfer RNA synthetases class-II family profile domain-containing protein n=1 Tax=Polymorphospora rubra TaxID=338584 RepID=A0A810NA68_9ACTN|nr:hypothetical protein [Polymorphospora rubra]BCJ68235.1 hypothetical protein Prubr_52560 [Polymorphospora rubra]
MRQELGQALCRDGYLLPTAVAGVYGRDGRFEHLVGAVGAAVSVMAAEVDATVVRYPPAVAADELHRVGYLRSFPHLAGAISVCADTTGRETAIAARLHRGGAWEELLRPSDLAPCPAACYPLYPHLAGRAVGGGKRYDTMGYCFRREPSDDPFRMQLFRMHEIVCVGDRTTVDAFLARAHDFAARLFTDFGLAATRAAATDPFFGSGGRMLAREQLDRDLKQEYVCPTPDGGVALASVNDHETHFTRPYGIIGGDGAPAVSACVGFGLERVVLAAFLQHGPDPADWPGGTQRAFGLPTG